MMTIKKYKKIMELHLKYNYKSSMGKHTSYHVTVVFKSIKAVANMNSGASLLLQENYLSKSAAMEMI